MLFPFKKGEYTTLKNDITLLKLKVQRLVAQDAKLSQEMNNSQAPCTSIHSLPHSALKLPSISIPQFMDNATGTISFWNFKDMFNRLASGMNMEEKIHLPKLALEGQFKRLVAN